MADGPFCAKSGEKRHELGLRIFFGTGKKTFVFVHPFWKFGKMLLRREVSKNMDLGLRRDYIPLEAPRNAQPWYTNDEETRWELTKRSV